MIDASNRIQALDLINHTTAKGAALSKACQELSISERTYYRWSKRRQQSDSVADLRPTAQHPVPRNKLSDAERQEIIDIVNQKKYASMPPCEIVPDLADQGKYIASESTFYRVLREFKQNNRRGRSQTPSKRKATTHCATAPNQIWMWDITYLKGPVKGTFFYLYLITDLYSRDIVGWEVWEEESAAHASELIQKAVLSNKVLSTQPLVLHSDNGSPMKGATMLETLYRLGITPSNSRPRVSNDNAYAESVFKTLKYRPNYQPSGFESLEVSRLWCQSFVKWYRTEHHHSGIQYLTPAQRHSGEGECILADRHCVYERAKAKNPARWNGRNTRSWALPACVYLNPERECCDNVDAFSSLDTVAS